MKKIILIFLILHFFLITANAQWVAVNDSINNPVEGFADNGNILYAAIAGTGVFKTTDYGNNWTITNNGMNTRPFNNICAQDSFVFVSSNYGLFRSTNYGLTFDSLTSHPGSAFAVIILNNFLFKGMLNGIHRSTDLGNSWVIVNNGINISNQKAFSLAYYNNIIYVGVGIGNLHIYKSTNFGDNWEYISQDIPTNDLPYSLYTFDNFVLCGTAIGVYKSTNYGTNWSLIPGIPGNIGLFGFASVGIKNIFISAWNYGVYVSNDYSQTFYLRNEGLANLRSTALYEFGNYLFLGTNPITWPCKIYRRPVSEVVYVKNISSEIPKEYKLYQNYPNPFNPSTKIRYQISGLSSPYATAHLRHVLGGDLVLLKVFDLLGKEIATLVNEKQAPGTYEVSFDASNLSTGIYFYSLEVNGKRIDTKKMLLIK